MNLTSGIGLVLLSSLLVGVVAPTRLKPYRLEHLYNLPSTDVVYAYARISPSGRLLAFTTQQVQTPTAGDGRIVRIVDLESGKVLFASPGFDAYWSPRGDRIIYVSNEGSSPTIAIHLMTSAETVTDVAPYSLGDYPSWGSFDGRDLIMTIRGNYYYLNNNRAVLPSGRVPDCGQAAASERPLISRDGKLITAFVGGTIVVRGSVDCRAVIDTGLSGAKADFSKNGRYVAFHRPRPDLRGYEIVVVDLNRRTLRRIPSSSSGSNFFPSWTDDGRLCFRYDSGDYQGFVMATNVLSLPEEPLPRVPEKVRAPLRWEDVVSDPRHSTVGVNLLTVWAPWSAHGHEALDELQQAHIHLSQQGLRAELWAAAEPFNTEDSALIGLDGLVGVRRAILSPSASLRTEVVNQIPVNFLFRDGTLQKRHLGLMTARELVAWVMKANSSGEDRKRVRMNIFPATINGGL